MMVSKGVGCGLMMSSRIRILSTFRKVTKAFTELKLEEKSSQNEIRKTFMSHLCQL
jgi:hypothetical protein